MSTGIRNVMLTGTRPYTAAFVNDTRENLPRSVRSRVFLREGGGHDVNDEGLGKELASVMMETGHGMTRVTQTNQD